MSNLCGDYLFVDTLSEDVDLTCINIKNHGMDHFTLTRDVNGKQVQISWRYEDE